MATSYPTRDELESIKRALAENGIDDPRALPQAIEAFRDNEFSENGVDAYVVTLAAKLRDTGGIGNGFGGHSELVEQAFASNAGKGNPDARARLVKLLGKAKADEAAQAFGLRDVGDFRNKGEAPPAFVRAQDKRASNPWSPSYKGKDPEGERIRLIRTLGTKAASEMARACQVDIAGRPLKSAAA